MTDKSPNTCISKYQQLLKELKTTVEGLLVSQVANVWDIYGGLSRLHCSIEKIFKHGCKSSSPDFESSTSYLPFVHGLEWLKPESSKSYDPVDSSSSSKHNASSSPKNKASIWLLKSLENHTLSQKLCWLLTDKTHLLNCYQEHAFLCQEEYAEAALICLRAVERNQASLLSEINPCLFLSQANAREFHKFHRRCSSFPDNRSNVGFFRPKPIEISAKSRANTAKKIIKGKLRPWHSLPSLQTDTFDIKSVALLGCSKTTPSTPIHTKKTVKKPLFTAAIKINKTDCPKPIETHVIIDNCDIVEHTPQASSSLSNSEKGGGSYLMDASIRSLPADNNIFSRSPFAENFHAFPGAKDFRKTPKKSFFDDGGMSVLPMATGYFPKPKKGQSLLSFLSSGQFARANAELDRENAHFSISEAIISAMEQIRCRRDVNSGESDGEDERSLPQRIRFRRGQKMMRKRRPRKSYPVFPNCDKSDIESTVSPCSTTPDTFSASSSSSENVDDLTVNEVSNLSEYQGLSASMASLYSEADVLKRPREAPDGASDIFSAEGVALSLISKFSENRLPRASDLEWLVSEEDAPQALLPLPKSYSVSAEDAASSTSLRGTQDWAPPRPQIIFTIHPAASCKVLMRKQNYRCAGCGMKVAAQYAKKFRYCNYLGRYFCTGCHTNQLALIPARIIHKWDFTRYPVSTFSYRLLEQMCGDPLFRIFELNPQITKISSSVLICRKYRLGLSFLRDFIYNCRYATDVKDTLQAEKACNFADPFVFSMEDLVGIRTGVLKMKLKKATRLCCEHVSECKLCLARGFICEFCKSDEVIFPWQLKSVQRCEKCGSCCHIKCWSLSQSCPKCRRISLRTLRPRTDN